MPVASDLRTDGSIGVPGVLGSDTLFRAVFRDAGIAIVLVDMAGRIVEVNPALERLLGYRTGELIGRSPLDFTHPHDRDGDLALFNELVEGSRCNYQLEKRYLRRDGTLIWGRLTASLIRSEQGESLYGIGMIEDITASRQMATEWQRAVQEVEHQRLDAVAAREATERLQDLTAALSEAVSRDDVGDVLMRYGVSALGAYAGVLALEVEGGRELELRHSIGYPEAACMGRGRRWPIGMNIPIAEASRTGTAVFLGSPQAWGERYLGGYAPSQSRSAAWAAIPLRLGDGTRGALLWTYDRPRHFGAGERSLMATVARLCIQALDRAWLYEAERSARAAAESASQAKSQFLAVMSHELRTPLNAILGYVSLLADGLGGPLTSRQKEQLDRVHRSATHLHGLIDQVLSLARIEAGREEARLEKVDLAIEVRDTAALVEPTAARKGLPIRLDVAVAPLVVDTDPGKVRQILLNLLSNAVKFTEAGEILVRVEREDDGDAIVEVSDTGIGIAEAEQERVWEPFTQVEHPLTRHQGGSGLGLPVSRNLARLLGGDLSLRSTPGAGSTFRLRLPG